MMNNALLFLTILLFTLSQSQKIIPLDYPLFKQCDPKWGNDLMGGNNKTHDTICIQGCAMTSVSMALAGRGFTIPTTNTAITPETLNHFLQKNEGYKCIDGNCNNLVLDAPDKIDPSAIKFLSEKEKPSADVISTWVMEGSPVAIAHVRNKSHFVLIVGYDETEKDVFYVNDPYFPNTMYSYANISDIITYTMG